MTLFDVSIFCFITRSYVIRVQTKNRNDRIDSSVYVSMKTLQSNPRLHYNLTVVFASIIFRRQQIRPIVVKILLLLLSAVGACKKRWKTLRDQQSRTLKAEKEKKRSGTAAGTKNKRSHWTP